MELSRQEYPALLRSLPPNQAVSLLDERVKLIGKINSDISDWLAERRRVEEAYVQGLRRLASRGPREVSPELGIFRTPWQTILGSMDALAESHQVLAQKIEVDVERPLKEFQGKNREMQAITTIQGNLGSIAKDVENAQKKASKFSAGKSSANKVASANSELETANQEWQSQAPYVFEQLQALDESRINQLRDVLTQLETHEADRIEKNRASAESCLNAILNINTSEEISAFVAKQTANMPAIPERQASRNRTQSTDAAPSELPAIAPTPSRKPQRPNLEASPYSTTSSKQGPPPSGKKGFGGLRRLGTVLSRDKGAKGLDRPSSPEKRSKPGRNPLRRGYSSRQDMQQLESPPQSSAANIPAQAPQLGDPLIRNDARAPLNQPSGSPQPIDESNGDAPDLISPPSAGPGVALTNGLQSSTSGNTAESQGSGQREIIPERQRDAEGFNVAPTATDDITRAEQEAAANAETDQSQLKLNIRNAPIQDEDDAAQQSAFSSVASTLRSQAGPARKPTTTRGRRDVRNTIFVPSGQSPESMGLGGASAPLAVSPPTATPPIPEGARGSDAQSVRSAHSLSSTTTNAMFHPSMHQPGLNASVIETVSATFQHGQVSRATVIGEMALQHNPAENVASPTAESVRLENFPVLEKVAPNPSFITQRPSSSGEYSVNLSHISRPAVAFKYQLHLDESNLGAHAPISLSPSWKMEANQASVILNYSLNPSYVAPPGRKVSVKNVIIYVNVEGTKAHSCQSKPAGIFSKEKSLIYWRLNDVSLEASPNASQRLLARFSTEGEAQSGNVEARWEISGDEAVGQGSGLALSLLSSGKEGTGASDPFADEDASGATAGSWKEVPLTRKIISGKYVGT